MSNNLKVIAIFATSLDGRLGPADATRFVRISSDADMEHLLRVRDLADAVIMGGTTFKHYPKPHRGLMRNDLPLHSIITSGKSLTFNEPLFHATPPVPVVIFSPNSHTRELPPDVDWEKISALEQANGDGINAILKNLGRRGVNTLLVEGGGEIFRQFLLARAVDELYLTLVPTFIGGDKSPRLTGFGAEFPTPSPRTRMLNTWQIGDERYFHLALDYDTTN